MKTKSVAIASLFSILLALAISGSSHISSYAVASAIGQDEATALESIRAAQSDGRDVTGLIVNYNTALELLQRYSNNLNGTCTSSLSCSQVQHAREILQSISDESASTNRPSFGFDELLTLAILLASLSAVGMSAFSIYLYRIWKIAHLNRFLDMEVKDKEE